jgi:antitoxin MazE
MKTNIIKVGNSKGLILNKTILEKYGFDEEVNLKLEDDFLIIEPVKNPRENWDLLFKEMHKDGDDKLLIPDVFYDESDALWE